MTLKDEFSKSVGTQYATGEECRNSSKKNEEAEPKQNQCPPMNMTGDGSKVQCCKEQYSIETWNVRSIVGSRVRHYWQNGGTALNPLPLFRRHGPGMKELGFVILTCFFLSSAELTEENIKVLIVFERSMRRHKAFCSCAQRIIHKVNHWHLFKDFYKRVFQGEHRGRSLRPWKGLLSEAYLWGKCLWQRSLLNLGLRNN